MLFTFNPFAHISERDSSLRSRNLRTSFWQKVIDGFYNFSSAAPVISYLNGYVSDNIVPHSEKPQPSLMAYLTGFSLIIVGALTAGLFTLSCIIIMGLSGTAESLNFDDRYAYEERYNQPQSSGLGRALRTAGVILAIPFAIAGALLTLGVLFVDFTLAAVFTLISLPVIAVVHAWSMKEGNQLKKSLKEELLKTLPDMLQKNNETQDRNPDGAKLVNNLFSTGHDAYTINRISSITYNDKKFKEVLIRWPANQRWTNLNPNAESYQHERVLLFSDSPEGRSAFDALIQLNMFHYDKYAAANPVKNPSEAVMRNMLETLTHSYNNIEVTSGCRGKKDNPFHALPLELIAKIARHVTNENSTDAEVGKISAIINGALKPQEYFEEGDRGKPTLFSTSASTGAAAATALASTVSASTTPPFSDTTPSESEYSPLLNRGTI
jgi:hypothetical protein